MVVSAYTEPMPVWQLEVLGGGCLHHELKSFALDRKTAALLCYLALEGPTPRSKVAGLLWPDSTEEAARANLRQLLRRFRAQVGAGLVAGGDPLALSGLVVDAAELEVAAFLNQDATVTQKRAELLRGYDYDDCPDFADWLFAMRERFAELGREAYATEASRLEQAGDYRAAVSWAEKLLAADPIAETPYRLVMRLNYLLGDRAAALNTFERCKAMLRREFDAEPMSETVKLAREIERGSQLAPEAAPSRPAIPLSVLRPPVLVGREGEWRQLEEAWESGKAIFIQGAPGVGKTRLLTDFLASKGSFILLEGRPGDAAVPFASQARALRHLLATSAVELKPWVRRELARLLPELGDGNSSPQEQDKLRFFDAQGELLRSASARVNALAIDNLQFYDAASSEVMAYLVGKRFAADASSERPRLLHSFRAGELATGTRGYLEQLISADLAVLIEVEPLGQEDAGALLAGLELPSMETAGLAAPLLRYTGGNPLFILETVKHLLESGRLEHGFPARLPPPEKIGALLRRRLDALPPEARRLAHAAAIAGEDFSLELAARVLESDPLDAGPWQALEAAQIFKGQSFSHDLVLESVLQQLPAPVAALLHARSAEFLEASGGDPARIAGHYLAAGEQRKAAPALLGAAEAAKLAFRLLEAAAFYEQAADISRTLGDSEAAFEALLAQSDVMTGFDTGAGREAVIGKLLELASNPTQKAYAYHVKADQLERAGRGAESEGAAREGCDWAARAGDQKLQAVLLNDLAAALWGQDRAKEAVSVFASALTLHQQTEDTAQQVYTLNNLGVALQFLERRDEAVDYFRRAERLAEKLDDKPLRVVTRAQLGNNLHEQGLTREALAVLTGAERVAEELGSDNLRRIHPLRYLGDCWRALEDYAKALTYLRQAGELAEALGTPPGWLPSYLARTLTALGSFEEAEAMLEAALRRGEPRALRRGTLWLARAENLFSQGKDADEALTEAEACLAGGRQFELGRLRLAQTLALAPAEALTLACQTAELARTQGLGGLVAAAETRWARSLLALGEPAKALEHSSAALGLLERYTPTGVSRSEVLVTHYQALEATGDATTEEQRECCLSWLHEVGEKVPEAYRESFLERSPYRMLKSALG